MVLHMRCVLEHDEGNPSLRADSIKLCLKGVLLGMHLKSHKYPTKLGIGSLISMDNI